MQVAYPLGTVPSLTVNGRTVPNDRIGTTSTLPSRGMQASSYVGVRLETGENRLEFRAMPEGGDRPPEAAAVAVIYRPGTAVELRLSAPEGKWVADGVTPGVVRVEAVDAAGIRAADAPLVTVTVDGASALDADADPGAEGHQVRLRDGSAVRFQPSTLPGRVHAEAHAERLDVEAAFE